jgi:hypothetical protein
LKKYGAYGKDSDTVAIPKFEYEKADSRNLKLVRNYFKLDSIAGKGNELSKIMNLLSWVHNNVEHNGGNYATCEFDAIDIFNYSKAENKGVNCRHLAIMLNEFYLALGIPSRYVTCMPRNVDDSDCHVINSVWVDSLQKWIWIDPTNEAYVTDENGNLLSIAEVRERLINDKPLVLNENANWNHKIKQTKEEYLYNYMAKNLFCLEVPVKSCFNVESRYRKPASDYVTLRPVGYDGTYGNASPEKYNINDPSVFCQKP